ncbi:MAG: hypothetical protein COB61_005770 [Thiotrichales bacterium]|nr:hypothetical protein [Thiotrichales bacterium]
MTREIFAPDLQDYEVTKLDSVTTSQAGVQEQNTSTAPCSLAIYDKGTKLIRQGKEDSYLVSTIHIYSDPKVLNFVDKVPYNGLIYHVLENKNYKEHSFYKAMANV